MKEKPAKHSLKWWKERGAQIEWRLEAQRMVVREMEEDLAECDREIKRLAPTDGWDEERE